MQICKNRLKLKRQTKTIQKHNKNKQKGEIVTEIDTKVPICIIM